jgi:uncharacterized protein DUF29
MSKLLERDLYDADFFAWTRHQSKELRRFARTRPNLPLDLGHLAEEIADLGKEQRNALRSWTIRIIEHLLLLEHSPAKAPRRGWRREIMTFRDEIDERLTPTLRRDLDRQLPRLYAKARRRALLDLQPHEAELASRLPAECPYTLDQILGEARDGE